MGNFLVAAMVFNAMFPVIEFFGFYGLRLFFRVLDNKRGFCKCLTKYGTNSTSIQSYIKVRAGQEILMHFKYTSILVSVYVTFMYGFGMPILFPIAAITFLVTYIIE